MSTTEVRPSLATGTWELDPVHSSIGFELDYMVGAFKGHFTDADAKLVVAADEVRLTGAARVASVDVKDENLSAHLQSPDFFDAERHPELTFASSDVYQNGERLVVHGEITIKGVTRPVELRGTSTEVMTDPYGRERLGLKLSTSIDRTEFGVDWNAPLPTGEPALANDVTLATELYFGKA